MSDVDREVISRALRWCAEAGRQSSEDEVRAALGTLSWDQLLIVKALLADPPPVRPLGPHALADIARGAPPQAAAEREREGRYLREAAFERPAETPPLEPGSRVRPGRRKKPARAAPVRVRRARDRVPEPAPVSPPVPFLEELYRPEGRAILERLVRELGTRRGALATALSAGWRRADGAPIGETDVAALLDEHGLTRAFERRERALLLHALRAAGGDRPRAAEEIGTTADGLQTALARLGAEQQAEAIREQRRADIRRRATLSERVRLLATDAERLADLGLLDEVIADLRSRLPEHLKALRAAQPGPLAAALGRSLSLSRPAVEALARRFGIDLGPSTPRPSRGGVVPRRGRDGQPPERGRSRERRRS